MMNDKPDHTGDDEERDTLLLESLQDLVPNSGLMNSLIQVLPNLIPEGDDILDTFTEMLKGYGTLLNVIQAASELEGTLHERLAAGYYELTNNDPPDDDMVIRLQDDD